MQKHISFVITAAVLLVAALVSVAWYTAHIANAQSNMTSAGGANNMTKGSNMTGAAGNTTGIHTGNPSAFFKGSSIHTGKPASIWCLPSNHIIC